METKIATNENQSKKLIDLGLSADSADMWWVKHYLIAKNQELDKPSDNEINDVFPAWSLSALIELMPKLMKDIPVKAAYKPALKISGDDWVCCYDNFAFGEIHIKRENSPLDAAFEMVCYLLENKFIK